MDFTQRELKDGARFSWNFWPCSRDVAQKVVVPVGCIYTPLKEIENMPLVGYQPVRCQSCQSVLNPHCPVDFKYKRWTCPICLNPNNFPQHYANHISEEQLPAELMQDYTTVEYILPSQVQPQNAKPIFMLLVDTAVPANELAELKDSLQQSINFIPEDALIGLITYGKMAYVHELGFSECPKAYVFRGDKDLKNKDIADQLGLHIGSDPLNQGDTSALKRFLVPVNECEFALNSILDDLQPDPWPKKKGCRPLRCNGTALNIAVSLLEVAGGSNRGSRIIDLIAGAVTHGQGKIVGEPLTEHIRGHLDIQKERENTKYLKPAMKFYNDLAARAQKAGIVIDIFCASCDQVGIVEMKQCFEMTGGYYVMTDSFGNPVFKESFRKFFEVDDQGELKMGFLSQIQVTTSKEFKISGAIGQCAPIKKLNCTYAANKEVGYGKTNQWYMGGIDRTKSLAFYFDIVSDAAVQQHHKVHLQFQTSYQHVSGQKRLRVTTIQRLMSKPDALQELCYGFDQDTAAVLMARYSVYDCQSQESMDVIRWLDRMLIKLIGRFAKYDKGNSETFNLPEQFNLFPQFMFYLRRSQLIHTFNASPDESAFYSFCVMRENVQNSIVMIQPGLMMYKMDEDQPTPVHLDITSLQDDVILMLDTFFYIAIWKGQTIVDWEKEGYHEQPEYENLKALLEAPVADAEYIMEERFPMPRFFICTPGDTNERKIKARVNPSRLDAQNSTTQSNNYFTEDVSLNVFMQHLIRMVTEA